jgi:1,4-dihydroxy-6-naphthoate synthase
MTYSIGISSCPNDTFAFYAFIHEFGLKLDLHICDLDHLNQMAHKGTLDIAKVSFFQFASLLDRYTLIRSGSALGYGIGPKIVALRPLTTFEKCTVAFPGINTTAHFLFDLFFTCKKKVFLPYFEIEKKIVSKEVDAGVIIHESRFTFDRKGLTACYDLGALWEMQYNLPLPLGGIVVKKKHPHIGQIEQYVYDSVQWAKKHPEKVEKFIMQHSIEKDPKIVQMHIDTYVNKDTESLSPKAIEAIQMLLEKNNVSSKEWLFSNQPLKI